MTGVLPAELREQVLEAARGFDGALKTNERKLDALVKASEQIMGVITRAARSAASPLNAYGSKGGAHARPGPVAPVAINGTY